jgi:hypothetical protein
MPDHAKFAAARPIGGLGQQRHKLLLFNRRFHAKRLPLLQLNANFHQNLCVSLLILL